MNSTLLGYLSALLASITGLFSRLTASTKSNTDKDVVIRDQSNQLAEVHRQITAQNVDEDALKAQVADFKAKSDAAIARSDELQAMNDGALAKVKEIAAAISANDEVPITVDPATLVHTVDDSTPVAPQVPPFNGEPIVPAKAPDADPLAEAKKDEAPPSAPAADTAASDSASDTPATPPNEPPTA